MDSTIRLLGLRHMCPRSSPEVQPGLSDPIDLDDQLKAPQLISLSA